MFEDDQIIREEMELLRADIIKAYNDSGKRVSGQFEEDLELEFSPNKGRLYGNETLAGRPAGGQPPVENLIEWVKAKGVFGVINDAKASSIAWAIAKKIAAEGTTKKYHLSIYDKIITPQRIQKILDRVSTFNAGLFVEEITNEFTKLTKGI